MNREIDFNELITPPEFESRCDMFVDEINEEVAPKYPEIGIHAANWHKTDYSHEKLDENAQEVLKRCIIKSGGEEAWKHFVDDNTRWGRIKDISSLTENEAEVEVWGGGGDKHISQVLSSIEEISEIALKYRGDYNLDEWEEREDLDNSDLPSAFLRFSFK